jgi:hypothetical protein
MSSPFNVYVSRLRKFDVARPLCACVCVARYGFGFPTAAPLLDGSELVIDAPAGLLVSI